MTKSLDLTREQFKALANAMEKAFDQVELDSLLQLECGRRLDKMVALPMPWGALVTQVVRKAQMQDFTDELVLAVAAYRPHNTALSQVLRELTMMPGQGATLTVRGVPHAGPAAGIALEGLVRGGKIYTDVDQFLADLAAITSRVCRIEDLGTPGAQPQALGTGFLVGDDLVLTNKHVRDVLPADRQRIASRFDYRALAGSTATRAGTVEMPAGENWWVAQRDYAPSDTKAAGALPQADQLDYALLRLDEAVGCYPQGQSSQGEANKARGHLVLAPDAPQLQPGDDIFVLQHPDGQPMKLAVGRVLPGAPPRRLWHDAPTEWGTSGSPCFNHALQLVALHHATDYRDPERPAYNQAVPIGLIAADLLAQGIA